MVPINEDYEKYLKEKNTNFRKAFHWIKRSAPEILEATPDVNYGFMVDFHDDTNTIDDEYGPSAAYFFGPKTKHREQNYRLARLIHYNRNPHHWQHWVLLTEEIGVVYVEMPYEYIVEMVCDWWGESWAKDDLFSIFDYYEQQKSRIKLHKNSRKNLEKILSILEQKIIKVRGERK